MLISCGGNAFAQVKSLPDLVRMYDYDQKEPLDVKEFSVEVRAGVKVHDISYTLVTTSVALHRQLCCSSSGGRMICLLNG